MRILARLAAAALALSLAACGSRSSSPSVQKPFDGWVDVAGMICADGSPTGVGVSRGRPDAVLFYLAGGGACWGETACNAGLRQFGAFEFVIAGTQASGTIFDRTLAGNPFADWTFVLVPYCTGDVHAGDTVRTYGAAGTWNHHGFRNLEAAVGAVTANLARPARLVVAGSSAGGFGALTAYDLLRGLWHPQGGTTGALVDDSGPTFVGTAIPPALLSQWNAAWGLDGTIGALCPACTGDLSAYWSALHGRHPADRLALLSTIQDRTMRGFFADPALGPSPPAMDPATFQASLDALVESLGTLAPAVAAYRVGGADAQRHALLADAFFLPSARGHDLLAWMSAMLDGDPSWASTIVP